MSTPRLNLDEILVDDSQKYLLHNTALRKLDALIQPAIESDSEITPPGSPSDGALYIPASVATGAWAGHENDIAQYYNSAWYFYEPIDGMIVWLKSSNKHRYYNGSAWTDL